MTTENWIELCALNDLIINDGVCALVGDEQVAVFRVGDGSEVYALSNFDPFGNANVMSRGIVGDLGGKLMVASPLYKQHYDLQTGICSEDESVVLKTYETRINTGGMIEVKNS